MKLKFLLDGGYKLYCGTLEGLIGTGWEVVTELSSDELFLKGSDKENNVVGPDIYPITSITGLVNYNTSVTNFYWAATSHIHNINSSSVVTNQLSAPTMGNSNHIHSVNPNNSSTWRSVTTEWKNLTQSAYNDVTKTTSGNNYRIDGYYTINAGADNEQNINFKASDGGHSHSAVNISPSSVTNTGEHTHGWEGGWDTTTRPKAIKVWLIRYTG